MLLLLLATSHRENMILLNEERIEFEDFIKLLSPNSSRLTKTNKSTNPIVKNYSRKNQNNIVSEKKSKSNPYNKIEINKNGDKFVYANYLFALDKAIEFLAENGAAMTESANIILDLALENGDVSMINVVEDYSPESIIDYTIDFDKSTPDNQVAYNYLRNLKARLVVTLT